MYKNDVEAIRYRLQGLRVAIGREFESRKRLMLFVGARDFTVVAKYWLATATGMTEISAISLFHNSTNIKWYPLVRALEYVNSKEQGMTIQN